jgi:starch synthase (maltosyl-transferring)
MAYSFYHLHPLVAGPLASWPATFQRVAAMGFTHVCLAPPFQTGGRGDISVHATFDRLHPGLGFDGGAAAGLSQAVEQAARLGLRLILDIAPARLSVDAPVRQIHQEWFASAVAAPDPRHPPQRLDIARPRFEQTSTAGEITAWWTEQLTRLLATGLAGFRCLGPDVLPVSFWRQVIGACRSAADGAMFLAWTPGLTAASIADLIGLDFDLTCSSAAWWDGRAAWFLDEHDVLRQVAPALASPEGSFVDRLAGRVAPDGDVPAAYRLSLGIAAAMGAGLFVPMGFEYATARRFDPVHASPADLALAREEAPADLSADIAAAIRLNSQLPPPNLMRPIIDTESAATAWLRTDAADIRSASSASLILLNPDTGRSVAGPVTLAALPPSTGAPFSVVAQDTDGGALRPGEVRVLRCVRTADVPDDAGWALTQAWAESARIAIEAVEPVVQGGDFPAKTVTGAPVTVSADIISDGHDKLAAALLWRPLDRPEWQRVPMRLINNDRWAATITPDRIGLFEFQVEAWWDQWGTFTHDLHAKVAAGQTVTLELQEGRQLVQQAAPGYEFPGSEADPLLSDEIAAVMRAADDRPFATRSSVYRLRADRPTAAFASWYELFPRSVTHNPKVHGTLRGVIDRLPAIRSMGFDVLYFPPINPIGQVNRKGRNNSLRAEPDDVGSPYAIGSAQGGHDAIHPDLGTLADFQALLAAAKENELEIALDFAVQCAPDHPWIAQHRDWFRWRPDGSMRYAENPPKKYEDIVNPDFYGSAALPAVWHALRDVIQFWVDQGVRIFRIDNPHTKPLPFWQWMIGDIQGRHPDVLFLAEAFTRPKLMYRLAKVGFSQSYTYFTWRNTKLELTEYLTELTTPPVADFFRPNFFVNTPDINPLFLQTSGRAGFLIRAALATTLSGLWGMYSGFEILESAALPGREEYLDSEKYQIRPRDYDAPGNIVAEITALNRLRRLHPALQTHLGLTFLNADSDQVLFYRKGDIVIAVSLDPHNVREATIEIPLWTFDLSDDAGIRVHDLMRGDTFMWFGKFQRIRLDPIELPFGIWRLAKVGAP